MCIQKTVATSPQVTQRMPITWKVTTMNTSTLPRHLSKLLTPLNDCAAGPNVNILALLRLLMQSSKSLSHSRTWKCWVSHKSLPKLSKPFLQKL
jgi:hypothetical protein